MLTWQTGDDEDDEPVWTAHDRAAALHAARLRAFDAHRTTPSRLADGRWRLTCSCGDTREADEYEALGWQCSGLTRWLALIATA